MDKYDVIIIGAGVAGALCACRIKAARPQARILLLEAGNNTLDKPQRAAFVDAYQVSSTKSTPSPYADLPNNKDGYAPSSDNTGDPVAMNRYYVETGPDLYKSGFTRMVGGSTWAWRGNTPRFLPSDFELATRYKRGVDWPFGYDELEPYYGSAEVELGVSGNDAEWTELTPRSTPYPMPGIVASYGDERVRAALASIAPIDGIPVTLLTTPQARNSEPYEERRACQGNSSCIPICPSGAKYDASVHVRKARDELDVEVRTACTVTRLVPRPGNTSPTVVLRDWTTPDKAEQQVNGNHVVLALNGIETPKLWLLSELDNRSDQVGRNLMDHLTEEVVGLFGEPVFPFRGPQSTLSIETFQRRPVPQGHRSLPVDHRQRRLGPLRIPVRGPRQTHVGSEGEEARAHRCGAAGGPRTPGHPHGAHRLLHRAAPRPRQPGHALRPARRSRRTAAQDRVQDRRLLQAGPGVRPFRRPPHLAASGEHRRCHGGRTAAADAEVQRRRPPHGHHADGHRTGHLGRGRRRPVPRAPEPLGRGRLRLPHGKYGQSRAHPGRARLRTADKLAAVL